MGGGHLGAWGVSPHICTCMCMHAHTHTCTFIHYRNCKWPPTWRHPCVACLACLTSCACVHVCMHGTPPHTPIPTPTPIHPSATPPRGLDPQNHLKFDNTSNYQDISIPFEDLKSVRNSPPMDGCVVWWVGGLVGGWFGGLGGLMGGVRSNH